MSKKRWYSFAQGSEKLHHGQSYISHWLILYPDERPPEEEIVSFGKRGRMISSDGIKWIRKRMKTKKEDAHASIKGAFVGKCLKSKVLDKVPLVNSLPI